jgi:hypothetical protein
MAWSTPDLSTITVALKDLLQTAINNSKIPQFNVNINCGSPETARSGGECQLTLYLLHVGRDPYWRNTPVAGPRPLFNNAQPLSLNLYYLLTAWANADFVSEQQAMSIALQCFHSKPIHHTSAPAEEFTISIEADTIEEMSRLWQAFATPIRLSSVVKVGVVFVSPAVPAPSVAKPPVTANLAVRPSQTGGQFPLLLAGTNLAFAPYPPPADPEQVSVAGGALVAVSDSTVHMAGAGLDQANAAKVYFSVPATAIEWEVTGWRQTPALPGELDLALPGAYADPATNLPAPPTATPPPGSYLLSVGRDLPKLRSNAVPLVIAARVDGVTDPPVLLPDATGVYNIAGAGFAPGATQLALGSTALSETNVIPPGAGEVHVNPAGTAIAFKLPSPPPPAGSYAVFITVNGIPCLPGWVVVVP